MKLNCIELQNFRKLKSVCIEFSEKTTIFVGANNSGKTSAMDALNFFLINSSRKKFSVTDFSISNWIELEEIASTWLQSDLDDNKKSVEDDTTTEDEFEKFKSLCPTMDIWLEIDRDKEIHHVSKVIPSLSWTGNLLGLRLCFEPKDYEKLKEEYIAAYRDALDVNKNDDSKPPVQLWPQNLRAFLERLIHTFFSVKAYSLDPVQKKLPSRDGSANIQKLNPNVHEIEAKDFDKLFKVSTVTAQRGFSDPSHNSVEGSFSGSSLSVQMGNYYKEHLDPEDGPDKDDLEVIRSITTTVENFEDNLNKRFKDRLQEIQSLGYPGFSDPQIHLVSKINPIDAISHDAALEFDFHKGDSSLQSMRLPEKHNGLGYKNLISMVFKLISFRDSWMWVGKRKNKRLKNTTTGIEPLHIVLIEEPEAHLHAQAQQVFIRKAYGILTNNETLKTNNNFHTQLIVSTHSSHLAHEADFESLRYFKRCPISDTRIPESKVVNMKGTFEEMGEQTRRFVSRYFRTTHCDLFFANGIIMVEGSAEKMLIPHFIRNKQDSKLSEHYISIFEVNGSHAHRFRLLVEKLGVPTLIVTDIDAYGYSNSPPKNDEAAKKQIPELGKNYTTNNDTLKKWWPQQTSLDDLLELESQDKLSEQNDFIRVAYQFGIDIKVGNTTQKVYPYTFEDALAYSNIELFKNINSSTGMLAKLVKALKEKDLNELINKANKALEKGDKAKMALDILFDIDPDELSTPIYIEEGLDWLADKLESMSLF